MPKPKKPVRDDTRIGLFFTKKDISLDIKMSREYQNTDIPNKIYLYRIDRIKTQVHKLYKEARASEKKYLPPVELIVKMTVEPNKSEYIPGTTISKQWAGNLVFTVYDLELEEKDADITKGDFVGIYDNHGQMKFYEVFENDKINTSNDKSIVGIHSFYRKIQAVPVDKDVFAG